MEKSYRAAEILSIGFEPGEAHLLIERRRTMHILSRLVAAVVGWLTTPPAAEGRRDFVEWADLPTYHPERE